MFAVACRDLASMHTLKTFEIRRLKTRFDKRLKPKALEDPDFATKPELLVQLKEKRHILNVLDEFVDANAKCANPESLLAALTNASNVASDALSLPVAVHEVVFKRFVDFDIAKHNMVFLEKRLFHNDCGNLLVDFIDMGAWPTPATLAACQRDFVGSVMKVIMSKKATSLRDVTIFTANAGSTAQFLSDDLRTEVQQLRHVVLVASWSDYESKEGRDIQQDMEAAQKGMFQSQLQLTGGKALFHLCAQNAMAQVLSKGATITLTAIASEAGSIVTLVKSPQSIGCSEIAVAWSALKVRLATFFSTSSKDLITENQSEIDSIDCSRRQLLRIMRDRSVQCFWPSLDNDFFKVTVNDDGVKDVEIVGVVDDRLDLVFFCKGARDSGAADLFGKVASDPETEVVAKMIDGYDKEHGK